MNHEKLTVSPTQPVGLMAVKIALGPPTEIFRVAVSVQPLISVMASRVTYNLGVSYTFATTLYPEQKSRHRNPIHTLPHYCQW